jgi:hypothetical protein
MNYNLSLRPKTGDTALYIAPGTLRLNGGDYILGTEANRCLPRSDKHEALGR